MDRETFLKLSADKIAKIVLRKGQPKAGVYIPDGNRRLVLAMTDLREGSDEFLSQLALTQTTGFFENLKTVFDHGLQTLFVPLFSKSVLMRGTQYSQLTVLKTLNILFTEQAWLDFYRKWDVKVKVYGDLSTLKQVELEKALEWIDAVERLTSMNKKHFLYLGMGGEPVVGHDVLIAARDFQQEFKREPKSDDELISYLYGSEISPVDFVIMTSKFGGLGAIPSLICTGNTKMFYLPVPGIMGLNEQTYRMILFDLLYVAEDKVSETGYELNQEDRRQIYSWYKKHDGNVIGLGQKIGHVRLPDFSGLDGKE